MKKAVLFGELEKYLPSIYGEKPLELTHKIYEATRITAKKRNGEFLQSVCQDIEVKGQLRGKICDRDTEIMEKGRSA